MSDEDSLDSAKEQEPSALMFWRELPVYQEYERGGFLIIQAVIEVFFEASSKLRRALREIAASLEDSGHFDGVELKVETVNSVKRPAISLSRGPILVVLCDSTIRATMSGNDLKGGLPRADFTELKSALKFSIDRIRESITDKKLQKSFVKPKFERIGTRIDYVTKLDQARVRGFDKSEILNKDWLSRFSNSEDKLAKFSVSLTPDLPNSAVGHDTTITIDRVDRVEVELQLGLAKVGIPLGPVARFIVIRGYLGENTLNLERINDTQEFALESVLQLFKGDE